jgi:hypothetical protein
MTDGFDRNAPTLPDMTGVPSKSPVDQRTPVRRALSWAQVAALCVAALTAIGAILTGGFDDTDGRVIATSLGFAIFSATAASGASLRSRDSPTMRAVGFAAMALSVVSFLLLLVALWNDGNDDAWSWFGSATLAAFACSHASLVSGAMRPSDTPAIQTLGKGSIALGIADSFFGILALTGTVDDIGEGFGQVMAVLVILLLDHGAAADPAPPPGTGRRPWLRGGRSVEAGGTTSSPHGATAPPLAAEVLAAADRIEALKGDPGNRTPEIRRECERLRELARSRST